MFENKKRKSHESAGKSSSILRQTYAFTESAHARPTQTFAQSHACSAPWRAHNIFILRPIIRAGASACMLICLCVYLCGCVFVCRKIVLESKRIHRVLDIILYSTQLHQRSSIRLKTIILKFWISHSFEMISNSRPAQSTKYTDNKDIPGF